MARAQQDAMTNPVRTKGFGLGPKRLEARAEPKGGDWHVHVFDGLDRFEGPGYQISKTEADHLESSTGADFVYLLLQICHVETQEDRQDIWSFGDRLSKLEAGTRIRIDRRDADRLFGTHGLREDLARHLLKAFALARGCSVEGGWPAQGVEAVEISKV